jgi:hypothetical protein
MTAIAGEIRAWHKFDNADMPRFSLQFFRQFQKPAASRQLQATNLIAT